MKKNLSVATILSVIMIIALRWQGSGLVTSTSTAGILDLEFAKTTERLAELLSHWDITVVKLNIWLDFIFIVAYTIFLSVASELCADKWPRKTVPNQAGYFFAKLAYLAGIFDVAENLLMLQSIQGNYSTTTLECTFYFAFIKFMLAAIIAVYLLASLPFVIRKK